MKLCLLWIRNKIGMNKNKLCLLWIKRLKMIKMTKMIQNETLFIMNKK